MKTRIFFQLQIFQPSIQSLKCKQEVLSDFCDELKILFFKRFFTVKIFLLLAGSFVAQGVVFDCKFSVENVAIIGDLYLCRATVLDSGDPMSLEQVSASHPIGKSNFDVEALLVENADLPKIPTGVEKIFPNLKSIQWRNSNLLKIDADDLKPFPSLLSLAVQMNPLEALDGDLFRYNPSIKSIEFDNNQICYVGEGLLSGLSDLQLAQFEGNTCIDVKAETRTAIHELNEILPMRCPQRTTTRRTTSK